MGLGGRVTRLGRVECEPCRAVSAETEPSTQAGKACPVVEAFDEPGSEFILMRLAASLS